MPPVYNMFRNEDSQFFCSDPTWPGGAALVAGQWRFSYFYKYVNRASNIYISIFEAWLTIL